MRNEITTAKQWQRLLVELCWRVSLSMSSTISVTCLCISWGAVIFETNCGLMQHSHIEIKNKLLTALDAEYNVVDMDTVFAIVTQLEVMPITAEILETTRLGKVVNDLRRKTNNELLAKRAKDLVRRWRHLLSPNTPTITPPVTPQQPQQNGVHIYTRQPASHRLNNAPSPSLPRDPKIEPVPKTHASNKRLRKSSPDQVEVPAKRSKPNGVTVTNCSSSYSFGYKEPDRSTFPPANDVYNLTPTVTPPLADEVMTPSKKRGRKKGTKENRDEFKEKLVAMSKGVKVKTTQELVEELKLKSDDSSRMSEDASLCVPFDEELNTRCNKSNHQTQINLCDSSSVPSNSNSNSQHDRRVFTTIEDEIERILSDLPPISVYDISCNEEQSAVSLPHSRITPDEVDRLHTEQIEGVNGVTSHGLEDTTFKKWHEMCARRTVNDDLLHILPYTIID